jgi:hypothetical protein
MVGKVTGVAAAVLVGLFLFAGCATSHRTAQELPSWPMRASYQESEPGSAEPSSYPAGMERGVAGPAKPLPEWARPLEAPY